MPCSPCDFIHPEGQAALENLQAIPLFAACVKAFMKIVPEQLLYGVNMAQKIRPGPDQLPDLYQHLPLLCATLGIAEPELYLEMYPMPNAYTYGDMRVSITVTSGWVVHLRYPALRFAVKKPSNG
jgi:hypothetical protein